MLKNICQNFENLAVKILWTIGCHTKLLSGIFWRKLQRFMLFERSNAARALCAPPSTFPGFTNRAFYLFRSMEGITEWLNWVLILLSIPQFINLYYKLTWQRWSELKSIEICCSFCSQVFGSCCWTNPCVLTLDKIFTNTTLLPSFQRICHGVALLPKNNFQASIILPCFLSFVTTEIRELNNLWVNIHQLMIFFTLPTKCWTLSLHCTENLVVAWSIEFCPISFLNNFKSSFYTFLVLPVVT